MLVCFCVFFFSKPAGGLRICHLQHVYLPWEVLCLGLLQQVRVGVRRRWGTRARRYDQGEIGMSMNAPSMSMQLLAGNARWFRWFSLSMGNIDETRQDCCRKFHLWGQWSVMITPGVRKKIWLVFPRRPSADHLIPQMAFEKISPPKRKQRRLFEFEGVWSLKVITPLQTSWAFF